MHRYKILSFKNAYGIQYILKLKDTDKMFVIDSMCSEAYVVNRHPSKDVLILAALPTTEWRNHSI
jgi:hypothetical protein